MAWSSILSGVGTALGGAGQLAGSLLGGGSSGVSGRDIKDAQKARLFAASHYGPKFGFHPLAALGASVVNPGWQSTDQRNLAQMGQGLDRMLSAFRVKEALDEDLKYKRLRNQQMSLENQAMSEIGKGLRQTGRVDTITEENLPLLSQKGTVPPRKTAFTRQGYEKGAQALEKIAIGEGGFISTAPTEGLEDYISESIVAQIQYELPKAFRWFKGDFFTTKGMKYLTPGTFRSVTREISGYLRRLERSHPPGKGWQYVWNPDRGQVRRMRILGGRRNVYDFSGRPHLRTFYR